MVGIFQELAPFAEEFGAMRASNDSPKIDTHRK
jgi:hypothetical protein